MDFKQLISVLVILLGQFIISTKCQEENSRTENSPVNFVVESNSKFANDFYQILETIEPSSFAASPISVSTALTLLLPGARGTTASELKVGLGYSNDTDNTELYNGVAQLMNSLLSIRNGTTLNIHNKLYLQSSYQINPEFIDTLNETFNVGIESTNFSQKVTAAAQINQWVNESTFGHVEGIISEDSISDSLKLLLLNVMYFKGLWKYGFNPQSTKKGQFYDEHGNEDKLVDMMSCYGKFLYSEVEELEAQVVSLPYQDDRLNLIIILPYENSSLSNLNSKLEQYPFATIAQTLNETRAVHVTLPRVKLESDFDMVKNGVITKLGMNSILTKEADFSGITQDGSKTLFVDQVISKVFMEINEEGTEAAVVTSVGLTHRISPANRPRYISFKVNRPFVAFIHDQESKSILFMLKIVRFS